MKLLSIIFTLCVFASCNTVNKVSYSNCFEEVWHFNTTNWNTSSLSNDGNYIYILTLNKKIIKVELTTGQIIWTKNVSTNYQYQKPLITKDYVYFSGGDFVKAFDKDGHEKWQKRIESKIIHTLVKYDSLLIGSLTGIGIYAFNKLTGEVVWKIEPENQMLSSSTPAIKDSIIVVGEFDYKKEKGNHLYAINARNGKAIWKVNTNNYFTSEPEIINTTVYINLDSSYTEGYTQAIDLHTGEILWENYTYPFTHLKPFYLDNKLFISSYKHGLFCLEPTTGEVIWTKNLNEDYPTTKIELYKDNIAFGTWKRFFYIIDLKGNVKVESEFEYGIGDPFIYNDILYVNDGKGTIWKHTNY